MGEPGRSRCCKLLLSAILFSAAASHAQDVAIGPKNADLQDGARALAAGNAEDGVRLTLRGYRTAVGTRDKRIALSNLCAGYILLDQLELALDYCNQALDVDDSSWRIYSNRALIHVLEKRFDDAERDLEKAESLNPGARQTRVVRQIWRDEVDPVVPLIEIDDRRQAADDVDPD